jgi:hypothetical protein
MTNNSKFARFGALLAASLFAATLPASYGCAALRAENAASTEELSRRPGFRSDRPIAPARPATSHRWRRSSLWCAAGLRPLHGHSTSLVGTRSAVSRYDRCRGVME